MPDTSTSEATTNVIDDVRVAKEAIVIVVGARPRKYARITVQDNRHNELPPVEIDDTDNPPIDEGDIGVSYAFAEGQIVKADHPAVRECPAGFRPVDATDELVYGSRARPAW